MCSKYLLIGIVAQCFFYSLIFADNSNAQSKSIDEVKVNVKLNNATFEEFISQVEGQTDFKFFFGNVKQSKIKGITLNANNEKLAEVLKELSQMTKLSFRQVNYSIGVYKNNQTESVISDANTVYQQITVTGKVRSDDSPEGLPGVNVVIRGTNQGTVTDINGNYSINVPSTESVLVFSSIGFTTEEVPVGTRTVINIDMIPDVKTLGEIVVVGYGTQLQGTVTGSVSKLSAEKLESKPVVSVESALQGQVSGVSVVNNGSPGVAPTVRIRGVGSVSYASDPLYVIDGVAVGNLNNFDVKDIESVSILKDAASAAIYGSRAAQGVVLITTKSGNRTGKSTLSFDASYGSQKAWKTLDLLNSEEYIRFGTDLITNGTKIGDQLNIPNRFSQMDDPIYEGATQTYAQTETDWQDQVFQTAPIVQMNVNYSGGNENSTFYTSYGRFSQEGIMRGTEYDRHSFRLNSDHKISKLISFGENIKVSYSEMTRERSSGGRTMVKHMLNMAPYVPVYNPTNRGGFGGMQNADGNDAENPVRIADLEKDRGYIVNILGNVYGEVNFTDWLSFRSSVGMEYTSDRTTINLPRFNEGTNSRPNLQLTDNRFTFFSPVLTNQLNIDKTIDKHYINAVLVAEQQITRMTVLNGSGRHPTNVIQELAGAESQSLNGSREETVLQSYAGRLNYAFDNKYLINFSIRRDGSSVFAPGKKIGYFPGGSIGWVVSRESFMDNANFISNLKLRASYGSLGFNRLGAYPWQNSIFTNTAPVFNNTVSGNTGAYFSRIANAELEWEITKMSNFGFDLALLDNSITLSADYFIRQTDNLIVENPLPTSMGYADNPPTNIGSMKNWGYEFTAGYNKSVGDFQFGVEGNISFVKNEVLKLSEFQPTIDRGAVTGDYGNETLTRTQAGYPIQGFYGWVVEGIFQSNDEAKNAPVRQNLPGNPDDYDPAVHTAGGDLKFKDIDGFDEYGNLIGRPDGKIDGADRTYIGSYIPDFSYGLNFTASYKRFSASMLVQGVQGNEIYNGTKVLTQGMVRLFNAEKAVLNAWTEGNTNTDVPRAVNGDPNANARTSTRFVEDGSYMRIKNLTIGYSLPNESLSSILNGAISGVNIYVTAQNLLTLTKYSGYDPEIGASNVYSGGNATLLQGVDFGFYPQPRSFILGVNVSF